MLGVKCLLIDIDNTLSTDHGTELVAGLEGWLEAMRSADVKLYILSNARGCRVLPFSKKINLSRKGEVATASEYICFLLNKVKK